MIVSFRTSHVKTTDIANGSYRLIEPFVPIIDGRILVIPAGFETDFETIPRLLFPAYALIRGRAQKSSVLHDFLLDAMQALRWIEQNSVTELLRDGELDQDELNDLLDGKTRSWADEVFYAAMQTEGTPALAREVAYAGVSLYTTLRGEK